MVSLTIDNQVVTVPPGMTIVAAAQTAGITIPTLCYLPGICQVAACRVCAVEIVGDSNLAAACNTQVESGMVIHTNSRRAREARRTNVELLLAAHQVNCPSCIRGGNCSLQRLAEKLGILAIAYPTKTSLQPWPQDFPLQRDDTKCVRCMRCITVCDKVQTLKVWDTKGSGSRLRVGVAAGVPVDASSCVLCGQCIVNCPVGALYARDDSQKLWRAIEDPETTVVVQIAPAVRAAWGEGLGLTREEASIGRLVAALHKMGVKYVFNTSFAADLTIMEEASELLQRMQESPEHPWPLFTSCCPGWVSFVSKEYPELLPYLSSAKSPQQMFGAIAKSWFAEREGLDPAKIFVCAIMPCVAKKQECTLPGMDSAGAGYDVDGVITARELDRMLKSSYLKVQDLAEEDFDQLLGEGSGAGIIFGVASGVTEAALRTAYYLATGTDPEPHLFTTVRGLDGWQETTVELQGTTLRAAVVNGLANARELMAKIKGGERYDFVEVMACPGGCVGGGGQPIREGTVTPPILSPLLYNLDAKATQRYSHHNKAVNLSYAEYLEHPLSSKAMQLLHVHKRG